MIFLTISSLSDRTKNISNFGRQLAQILLFCSFFPWTNFNFNSFDSQPWSFIFGTIYVISLRKIKLPGFDFIIFSFFIILGLFLAIFVSGTFSSASVLRGCFHYLTLLVLCVAFYNIFLTSGFPLHSIVVINVIWLILGGLELLFPNVSGVFSHTRTSLDRGVTSFAPEPYYFGVSLVFFNMIISYYYFFVVCADRAKGIRSYIHTLILLNVMACIFLSQSLSAFILMAFQIVLHVCLFLRSTTKLYFLFLVILFAFGLMTVGAVLFEILLSSRFAVLVTRAWEYGVYYLVSSDGSANQRLESIVMPIVLFIKQFPFPGGFENFYSDKNTILVDFPFLWYPTLNNSILSWVGALFYELGLWGALSFWYFLRMHTRLTLKDILFCLTLAVILISALPVSFPPLAFLVSARIWMKLNA